MTSQKIKLMAYFCLFLIIETAMNVLAVILPSPIDVIIGYITGLCGFLALQVIRDTKIRRISLIILPILLTLVTSAIISAICYVSAKQNICARNPLILSSIPMFIIFTHWGFTFFTKKAKDKSKS